MLALHVLAIFTGSALLFLVQPLVAKAVLPQLGGSAAVWNTAMVFFQAALLAGYLLALGLARLGRRAQVALYALMLALPFAVAGALGRDTTLLPSGWTPPVTGSPVPWLLAWLGAAVGLPFVALAAASPLLQRWFAGSDHLRARDPYFLYGASNLGSFAALLAYPLLVEPRASIPEQARGWSAGFALFALLAMAAGIAGRARAVPATGPVVAVPTASSRGRERLRWLALSLVPSSWLLGVTQHISTDIAVFPLLWVVPLALYLLTFVAAFSRAGESIGRGAARLLPWAALGVALLVLIGEPRPMVPQVLWHLAAFVLAGLACHGRLAALRPGPERLNEYYLVLALGGVAGGVLNSLVAPLAFDGVAEYPLAIAAGCLLVLPARPRDAGAESGGPARWRRAALALDLTLPPALVALYLAVVALAARAGIAGTFELTAFGETAAPGRRVLLAALATGTVTALVVGRRLRFALALAALFAIPRLPFGDAPQPLHAERTFFGVYRVTRSGSGDLAHHDLWHGSTLHGRQNLASAIGRIPSTYYAPSGPVGDVLRALRDRSPEPLRFALIGLGTGSIAAYGRPEWSFDYYEIDPAVVRIASDPKLFRYLAESASPARFLTGDARLALAREGAERYDAIVLDAFSSDAVPVHLLTREALGLYLERLRDGGLLLFHVTNRHFDLEPVLAAAARERGLVARLRDDPDLSPAERALGKAPSRWLVVVRREVDLGALGADPRWREAIAQGGFSAWTDARSDVLGVLRWRR